MMQILHGTAGTFYHYWKDVSDRLVIRACHLSIFGWQTREHRSNRQMGAQAVNHTVYTVQSRKTKTHRSTRTLSTNETPVLSVFAGFVGYLRAAMNFFAFADCRGWIRPKLLLRLDTHEGSGDPRRTKTIRGGYPKRP
jgi:hypothetical protein